MGKGTKELLHKLLSNQKLIMEALKIKEPSITAVAAPVAAIKKANTIRKVAVKKVALKNVRKKR